jgi:hypothetical protein
MRVAELPQLTTLIAPLTYTAFNKESILIQHVKKCPSFKETKGSTHIHKLSPLDPFLRKLNPYSFL